MSRNLLILTLIVISGLSLFFNYRLLSEKLSQSIVTDVVDGDTFQLTSGKRVRLMGVDAPEYNRCGGKEARARLTDLINGKRVKLTEEVQETFGRSLALVYADGELVNETMLKEGWGRADYRANSQRDVLTKAFHEAQTSKKGIWSALCRIEPTDTVSDDSGCTIKANIDKNTYQKFYHYPGCKQYNQIVIEKDIGERYFCTREEAEKAGFVKASGCP